MKITANGAKLTPVHCAKNAAHRTSPYTSQAYPVEAVAIYHALRPHASLRYRARDDCEKTVT